MAVLLIALASGAGCGQDVIAETAVAKVDGQRLGLEDFSSLAAFMGMSSDPKALTPEMRRAVVESLVDRTLVLDEAKRLGLKLDQGEVARQERIMRRGMEDESFDRSLAVQGIDYATWREELRKDLLARKTVDLVLASKVRVTPDEVRQYYEAHKDEFQRPEQVLAQHAVLPTREMAEALLNLMSKKPDMRVAARSLGMPLSDEGRPTWLSRGHMPQELEDKIFAASPGKPAGPFDSQYGHHVVLVMDKRPATLVSLGEAVEGIQRKLGAERMESMADEWMDQLASKADIWVNQVFLQYGTTDRPEKVDEDHS